MSTDPGVTSVDVPWYARVGRRRLYFTVAVTILVVATVLLVVRLAAPTYSVLFSELTEADAASVIEQLKVQKTSYRLGDDGGTIMVPAAEVYETRLALVSKGLPLSGGVGFELFDKQSYGMDEASHKVAYQRALQGELARTIGALENVQAVRVHLVLPEASLFRREQEAARAAVTVTMRDDARLTPQEIEGIQRLVAASVQGLAPADVVITDHRGVALSPPSDSSGSSSNQRLEVKRAVEDYFTAKVSELLRDSLGPGQAIVSVDADLDFSEVKRTVQDLLPIRGPDGRPVGALTHRRSTSAAVAGPAGDEFDTDFGSDPESGDRESQDSDYQYGSQVEQVIAAPGSLRRLTVGVIVRPPLQADEQQRLVSLISATVGLDPSRGDSAVLQSIASIGGRNTVASSQPAEGVDLGSPSDVVAPLPSTRDVDAIGISVRTIAIGGLIGVMVLIAVVFGYRRQFGPPMSDFERERVLAEIRTALAQSEVRR